MIINKEIVDTKKKRDGTEEPVYKMKLNVDFWRNMKEPVSVVLDEFHNLMNSRRSMSNVNILLGDWIALLRRVLGQDSMGHGDLIAITQLGRKLDINIRDMAHQVRYHVCHYIKTCKKCGTSWRENSEIPEPLYNCIKCNRWQINKHSYKIEVWKFKNIDLFESWRGGYIGIKGNRPFYDHHFIVDIEKYFPMYSTLQWESLFENLYN